MDETKNQGTDPKEEASAIVAPSLEEIKALFDQSIAAVTDSVEAKLASFEESMQPSQPIKSTTPVYTTNVNTKTRRHVNFGDAFKHWAAGDDGAMRDYQADHDQDWGTNPHRGAMIELKASNATSMVAGTDAAGGAAVPQGHVNQIIAKRDEASLAARVGVMSVPGSGTTVHLPIDNEADGEFVSTSENAANDMDSPALDTKVFTLVKYTKRIPLTDELLNDETSALMSFIENFVGRGMAKTHNNLLLTEVATSGTEFKVTASSVALAFGELEDVLADNDLSPYLDDGGNTAWVMQAATYWGKVAQVTSANNRMYTAEPFGINGGTPGGQGGGSILGSPVYFSQKAAALSAADNKFAYFGNWFYVGVRNDPSFRILRDPYSEANLGRINLHYFFRTVYKCIQEEAIGYMSAAAS